MPFLIQYQAQFLNNEGQLVTINLSDTESGVGTPTPINLVSAGAELIVVNDDEDKFSVIKGKRLEFSFVSTATESLTTFIFGSDNKWLVECLINTTQIFSGFLVTDQTRESFLPPATYLVHLVASDNLGLLKDIPLTKPDGTNPRGRFRLVDFVAWALKPIGLDLPINIAFNLKPEELTSLESAFDKVYTQSKTWEAEINESIDCYEVLQRLLLGCFLTQENNEWWIVRIDEMNGPLNVFQFDSDGLLLGVNTFTLTKNVGRIETIKFISKDADVMLDRPVKYDKLTYKFEYPKEIIDNIDFNRGTTWISPFVVDMYFYLHNYPNLSDFPSTGDFDFTYHATSTGVYYKWTGTTYAIITGGEIPQGLAYVFEDWTLERDSGSVAISAHVVKIRQYGDEKSRYVEMTAGATLHRLKSSRVPVGYLDKFTFSVDRRINFKATGSGQTTDFIAQIRLFGEDGTFWTITNYQFRSDYPGKWVQSNSTFTSNPRFIAAQYVRNNTDTRNWIAGSVDADPVPVSGDLEILLLQHSIHGPGLLTHFANLQFHYIPYINGTYQKFNSLHNKVSQTIKTKNKREEQVYLYDRIKALFKGALEVKTAGGQYHSINGWYDGNLGTTGALGIASYGKYQAFDFWNQNRRVIRKIPGSLLGLDSATQLPGLLHQYNLTAVSQHTTNKIFLLLSFSQNLDTCQWSGTFAELDDSVDTKIYNSDHELKFLTGNDD